jgi:hypothetical protein
MEVKAMDPDVTYALLVEAIEDQDMDAIAEHWAALDGWLKMGAHAPKAWDMRMRSRGR